MAAEVKSKKELGEDYGMRNASAIKKEWFEQAEALEAWMVGKTPAEITGLELLEEVPQAEDLMSSVTIKVVGYLDAFKEAAEQAR